MKTFRINTTTGRGQKSENLTLTLKAKNETEAKRLTKEYWESQGKEVVTQWRGV